MWIYERGNSSRRIEFIPSASHTDAYLEALLELHPHLASIESTQQLSINRTFYTTYYAPLRAADGSALRGSFHGTINEGT